MGNLWQDLRYAMRVLGKSPGFTAVAVLTIAIGIAANVSIFSFVDALFLRSVPAKDPSRLVRISAPGDETIGLFSYPEYAYLRDHAKTLELLAAHYSGAPLYVTANGATGEVAGAVVSSNYFEMLGLRTHLGRFFTPAEDSVPDRDAVAVLGYGFWKRTYSGDAHILGKTLAINGQSFEIIGVMSPEFRGVEIGGTPNEIWIPTKMMRVGYRPCDGLQPSCTFLELMGRLTPGTSTSEAQAEIATLMRQLQTSASGFDERWGVFVTPAIGISYRRPYFGLFTRLLATIGGVLFLIVCANLGGLLLARGRARAAELAMREALGATPTRIARQLLTESLLLACAGGVLAVLISLWTSQLLAGFYSTDSEGYRHIFDIRMDIPVLAYSVAVTFLGGLIFGLLPSWQASRPDLNQVLKSGGRALGWGRNRSRTTLVAVQIALSLALLVGAGLMARSGAEIEAGRNIDLSHALGVRLQPGVLLHYPPDKTHAFKQAVLQRLRSLPGVESVSLAQNHGEVWEVNEGIRMTLPGETYAKPDDEPVIGYKPIAPDYFATLRIRFVVGRDFTDNDRPGSPRVAIVNETLASKMSRGKLPLDQIILLDGTPYQVVGVVKDAQLRNAIEGPEPVAYVSFWQGESDGARMCVRVIGPPGAALPTILKAIASVDPNVPVTEAMPLIEQVRGEYTDARVAGMVLSCTAAIGLLLSAMGIYGVISYEVSRRTREIGIRMAVGAQPKHVVMLFLRQGLNLILVGSAVGGLLAFMTTHLLAAWLFGVRPSDLATFFAALSVLLAVVLLASYIPARRAAKVDPMVALRYE